MGKWNSETDKDKIPEIGYVSENNWGTDKESNIGNKIWKREKIREQRFPKFTP